MTEHTSPPRIFISYSHDSQDHKFWVLSLATRLMGNGVDVILDQWDLTLGGDLPRFMETGLTDADRVLAVCTSNYVAKANGGLGGVGYEKMILTAQLMKNVTSDRIIPIVRDNDLDDTLPVFLAARRYVDFRDSSIFELSYSELIRDIHGVGIQPRPPIGTNPFIAQPADIDPAVSFQSERDVSPSPLGSVDFDHSNNDGKFLLGSGDMSFVTRWSNGGKTSVHAYRDGTNIETVALATDLDEISAIKDARVYDTSSRVRTARLGDIVVWRNVAGYYLATKIEQLQSRSHGDSVYRLAFSYQIAPNKKWSF